QGRVGADADLRDLALVRGRGDLDIRHRVVFVVPDEDRDRARLVRGAVEDALDVGARPRVDGRVVAVVAVVAQRRCDERVGGQVVDVEFAVRPDLRVAEVVVAVAAGRVRVRPEVVEGGDVLGRVAARRATGRRALDVASRGAAGDAHLPEDVVVRRS